ncbi:MAG: flagellar motor switch protein FliG [Treponema sp.]|nr:flagellar motor switch protein FliG [Treponema sp.]
MAVEKSRTGGPGRVPKEGPSNGEAGLIKTGPGGDRKKGADSKIRRTAKFLILIGSERAAEILSRLEPEQVSALSGEIASIRGITADEGEAILEEFGSLLSMPAVLYAGTSRGGVEAARRILHAAYGPEKGEELLVRAAPEARAKPFAFLEDFSGEQLALLFKEESPAAAALVFSRLPPKLAAAAIARSAGDRKLEIVKRIARQTQTSPEVLERMAGALREKARHVGSADGDTSAFDGIGALAAILKSSGVSFGDHLLGELEEQDPDLSKTIKEKIYTLEDLIYAADLPVQKKLASMENREILLLLKGRSAAFREKILGNLSQGRRAELLEDEEIMGPVPKKEAGEAAGNFLSWFRQSREEGRILMLSDDDVVR